MVHKTIAEAEANLKTSIAYIPERYKAAVAKADWATAAQSDAAESNYASGVALAAANKTRQKKLRDVSNETWKSAALAKGGVRIGPGITESLAKYRSHMGPVLDAMNAASDAAPVKTTDWRSNITNRLYPVVEAAKRAAGKPM